VQFLVVYFVPWLERYRFHLGNIKRFHVFFLIHSKLGMGKGKLQEHKRNRQRSPSNSQEWGPQGIAQLAMDHTL
jgi:hypothetical protein